MIEYAQIVDTTRTGITLPLNSKRLIVGSDITTSRIGGGRVKRPKDMTGIWGRSGGQNQMLDKDGYPTDESLQKIESWKFTNESKLRGLLDFLNDLWHWPDFGFVLKGKNILHLQLHTGGWSGNESIIFALQNTMFWWCFWEKSVRGGHYYFKINLKSFFKKADTKRRLNG